MSSRVSSRPRRVAFFITIALTSVALTSVALIPGGEILAQTESRTQARTEARTQEVPLGRRTLELELDTANLEVTVGPGPAVLEATGFDGTGHDDGSAMLRVSTQGVEVQVRRPEIARDGDPRPRLDVAVHLNPGQGLRLRGDDLEIAFAPVSATASANAPRRRQRTPTPPRDPNPPVTYDFVVARSKLTASGLRDADITLLRSHLLSDGSEGRLIVKAESASEAEVLRHRGSLEIEAEASDVVAIETDGDLGLALADANALLRDGRGAISGTARRGLVAIERWSGDIEIGGEDGIVEVEDVGPKLAIDGRRQQIRALGGHGTLEIRQRQRVALTATGWRGRADLDFRGSGAVILDEMVGAVALALDGDASATVTHGDQTFLDAELSGGQLDASSIASLAFEARGATITAGEIRRLAGATLVAGRAELDLRQVSSVGTFAARDGAELEIRFTTPCHLVLSSSVDPTRTSVAGCSVDDGRGNVRPTSSADGHVPIAIRIDADETATLTIRTAESEDDSVEDSDGDPGAP